MPNVTVAEHIKASGPKVWELIGKFDTFHRWAPGITGSTTQGTGPGAIRNLTLAGGAILTEKLISRADEPLGYTYSIEAGEPGLASHISTLMVVDHGDGSCTVSWVCNFAMKNTAETDSAAASFKNFYRAGIAALKKRFEGAPITGLTAAAQRAPAPPRK